MSEPTLQANFSANTAGFSQGVSALQQKLNELNTALEQSKQESAAANAQIRAYQQELQRLEKATQSSNTATEAQKQQMTALLEKLTGLRQGLRILTEEYELNRQEIKETKSDISSYEKELYKLNAATDNGKKATAEQSQRMDTLRGKIEVSTSRIADLAAAQSELKGRINSTNAEIRQYERELIQLRSQTNNGTTATDEQKQRMQELRDKIAQTTSQLGTMRTTQQDLQSQIKKLNSELQDGAEKAASFGDVLKASLCSAAVQTALSKLTESLKQTVQYCYNVGSSFEAGMSQVEAISGATADEMEQLTQKAKELGAATKFTASEAAEAMNYMAMAGWDAGQMLDGIEGVISLAAASGEDLGQVSDIVTDAITAFGLAAEDVNHFSDVLAAASAASNTNVSMMGETFKYCSTLAGAMGFAIEDVAEAIGVMANSGTKSTMAGTALRTLLAKLSDDVKITGDAIGEVTIKTSNADGTMRGLTEILTDMRKAWAGLSESERATQAEAIAGKNAMSGFLALMNAGTDDVVKLRTAIDECNGASALMAETMQENVAGSVVIMQSALEGLGIAVYDHFGENLKTFVDNITDVFSSLTERVENGEIGDALDKLSTSLGAAGNDLAEIAADVLPGVIEGIAGFITLVVNLREEIAAGAAAFVAYKAAALGLTLISKAVAGIKAFSATLVTATAETNLATAAWDGFTAAIAANPIGAIVVGISAAVGLFTLISSHLDDCNEKMEKLNDNAKKAADSAEKYASDSDKLKSVKERYIEIEESADDALTKEEQLKELQAELSDEFGNLADNIDLVTGAFESQVSQLDTLVEKYSELSEFDRTYALRQAREAENEKTAIKFDATLFNTDYEAVAYFKAYAENLDTYDSKFGFGFGDVYGGTAYFSGTYEQKIADLEELKAAMMRKYNATGKQGYADFVDRINEQLDILYEGQETINALEAAGGADSSSAPTSTASATAPTTYTDHHAQEEKEKYDSGYENARKIQAERTGVDWDDFSSIKSYLQYLKDVEEISSEEYYNRLEAYANQLLEENSEEWRSVTAEIYKGRHSGTTTSDSSSGNGLESQYDSEKEYLKWRLDMGYITEAEYYEQIAVLRDKYLDENSSKWRNATLEIHKYQVAQNGSALDEIEEQYNDAIAAIDEEIKQHNRDREDEDIDSKIAEVDKQLQYDRLDDYSRMQLEQKKQELLDEKEETEWQREKEDEKEMLGAVYTMAKEAYDQGVADLNSALQVASAVFGAIGTGAQQTASTVSTVNNNSVSMIMNAVSQTSDQIAAAVIKALSSSI